MARIRSVHPSLFTDERWVGCSPMARLLYIGLLTEADDQGLFEWKPIQIKIRLLPVDNADVGALLAELVAVDLIASLESGGKKLGAIRKFRRFQRPKKPNAQFVLPDEWRTYVSLDEASSPPDDVEEPTVPPKGEPAQQMEDGGDKMEEIGEESSSEDPSPGKPAKPPKAKARRSCPPDWIPSQAVYDHGEAEGLTPGEIERELAKMRRHEFRSPRSHWDDVAKNWLETAAETRSRNQSHDPRQARDDAAADNLQRAWDASQRVVDLWPDQQRTGGG